MKLLFIHDHPFFKELEDTYSGGSFPASIWSNYIINFDEIAVFGRRANSINSKVVLSSGNGNVTFHLTSNYSSVLGLFKNYFKLKKEMSLLMRNVDIVLVRLPSILGFVGASVARQMNKKLWIEVVGNAKESMISQGSLMGVIGAPILENLAKSNIRNAHYVSYVTESKLQKDYPSNLQAINVSLSNVIIPKIIKSTEINFDRFKLNPFKIALIGGFNVRYKGQDILLKAISLLPESIKKHIELYFIGIGDPHWIYTKARSLNVEDNIKFIGTKESGGHLLSYLKDMTLYIQPSLTEGMPRALLEAMSVGCPVMGSKVGGIPDVVNPDLQHEKGDYKTIANQIKRLFQNRRILQEEAQRSIEIVRPFLKTTLDDRRREFYTKMNNDLVKKDR